MAARSGEGIAYLRNGKVWSESPTIMEWHSTDYISKNQHSCTSFHTKVLLRTRDYQEEQFFASDLRLHTPRDKVRMTSAISDMLNAIIRTTVVARMEQLSAEEGAVGLLRFTQDLTAYGAAVAIMRDNSRRAERSASTATAGNGS